MQKNSGRQLQRLAVISIVIILGISLLMLTHAASNSTALEAEDGLIAGTAQLHTESSASKAKYIQFASLARDQYIYFTSNGGTPTQQIWRMKADGTNRERLTNDPATEHNWVRPSPNGQTILYFKADPGSGVNDAATNRLWMMNPDGSNQREVLTKARYGWSAFAHGEWSPDSQKIVLAVALPSFTTQLITINADGSSPTQITQPRTIDGVANANAIDPSWPQTNSIMFIRSWNCFFLCGNQDVFRLNLTDNTESRITNDSRIDWDPYITPDGTQYVWLKYDGFGQRADLYRSPTSGTPAPTPVIADGGVNTNGTLSADSQFIVFLKQIGTELKVHRIKIDGTDLTQLSNTPNSTEGLPSYWP